MNDETPKYDQSVSDYSKVDKFGYKGWMNSDKFLKRAFGVLGYQMVASCMIQAVIWTIIIFFVAIFGGFGALFNNS
jgi:hypothetical protein